MLAESSRSLASGESESGAESIESGAQRIREALGGAAGGGGEGDAVGRDAAADQAAQERQHDRSLAGPGTARDDREILVQGGIERTLLIVVENKRLAARDFLDDDRPGHPG